MRWAAIGFRTWCLYRNLLETRHVCARKTWKRPWHAIKNPCTYGNMCTGTEQSITLLYWQNKSRGNLQVGRGHRKVSKWRSRLCRGDKASPSFGDNPARRRTFQGTLYFRAPSPGLCPLPSWTPPSWSPPSWSPPSWTPPSWTPPSWTQSGWSSLKLHDVIKAGITRQGWRFQEAVLWAENPPPTAWLWIILCPGPDRSSISHQERRCSHPIDWDSLQQEGSTGRHVPPQPPQLYCPDEE